MEYANFALFLFQIALLVPIIALALSATIFPVWYYQQENARIARNI
jgi:nitrate reductase NapE component